MCTRYRLISLTLRRGVSVLEGIGLSNNPKYSIINACLPYYVSKRLLTDKSEHTIGALPTFFFGPRKNDSDRIIDYDRAENRFLVLEKRELNSLTILLTKYLIFLPLRRRPLFRIYSLNKFRRSWLLFGPTFVKGQVHSQREEVSLARLLTLLAFSGLVQL